MSNNLKHNTGKFIYGSIYKITLNNFMIYSEIEFFPGQSLNLIIGPNGSGKSSIIYGIILGLGGNLSDISKTKKLSYFIKKNTDVAKIEIELYQKTKQTMVITTYLDRLKKKFVYQKDHKTITKEELLKCMEGMGIQVSNLCQMLPQLRVEEFSNLNPKQLLENTISGISGFNGVSIRNDLINMSKELEQLVQGKQIMGKKVRELIKLNERDKSKIENMEKKKELDIKQKLCEIKMRWIECNDLEEEIQGYKAEIDSNRKPIAEWENKKRKMEKEKDDIHKNLKHEEGRKNFINKKIDDLRRNINHKKDMITSDERRFEEIEAGLARKERENLNREQELNKMSVKLEKIRQDRCTFIKNNGDENFLKVQLEQKNKEIEKLHQNRHELERKKLSIEMDKSYTDITDKIRSYKAQLGELQNKNAMRMKLLEKQFNHTYQALLWLRDNRGLFKHPVYEPMLLEINFEDEKYAKFLENTVPYRDLTAFSFEDSNDMEKFLKIVRSDLGFKRVSACKVSTDTNLQAPPIDNIRRYGFSCYLSETFQAPRALKQYLCALYAVHRVPLGDAHAAANMERVPADLQLYFTDQRRVRVKKSAYSGLYSRNTSEIRPARLLGSNQAQIKSIEENLANLVNEQNVMSQELDRIKRERDDLTSKIGIETTSKETIRNYIEKLRSITKTLEVESRRYKEESEIDAVDMEMERARARQQQADTTRRLLATQPDLLRDVRSLHAVALYRDELSKRINSLNQEYVKCEGKIKEFEREVNELKKIIGASESKMDDANRRKMTNFQHIQKYCNNKLPNDPEFPFEQEFQTLPSRISGLKTEQYKIKREYDSIQVNLQIVKDYEDREKAKEEILVEIEETNRKIETLKNDIQQLKPMWLTNLKSLLGTISESFGKMFNELKYMGEVLLDTGDDEEDIGKYGINIMVSYRAGQPLQRLDPERQSGGERAAATACYLLALQAVAAAPFRCLDEINQGMDTKNERSFVELLMGVSSRADHCQYFLVSPKLLKNLKHNDTVKVHVVMNGESSVPYKVWQIDTFLDKARAYGKNNRNL